jgi:hypothetical protein
VESLLLEPLTRLHLEVGEETGDAETAGEVADEKGTRSAAAWWRTSGQRSVS